MRGWDQLTAARRGLAAHVLTRHVTAIPQRIASALRRRPMRHQLMLLVLTTALPLLLASLLMFNQLVENERQSIRQGLVVGARTLAALVDNEIDTHAAIASTLAHSPALQTNDLETFWREARQALEFVPGAWLAVSDPQAQIVLNTLTSPGTVLPKHAAPDVVQRGFATGRPQVGDLVMGPVAQRLTGFVEVPVFRNGAPLYSLSIALVPARFRQLMMDKFTHDEVVAIVDRRKTFVARIPDKGENKIGVLASEGWRAAMAKSPEGWTENQTLEGDWSITGYAQTAHGWSVGIAQLDVVVASPLRKILWASALTAGVLTLLSLALATVIARNTNRGMTALAQAARQLGKGQVVVAPPAPFAEADTIAAALAGASSELKRRGDLLARANSELEDKVAERTQALVIEMKQREAIETTLRQAQKMDTLGQLTGGIAHDFNNLLTIIMGNLDTVQRRLKNFDLEQSATLSRPVEAALQGSRSAAKLTQRLLAFSRQQPLEPKFVNLNSLVAGLSDMLARTVGETIELEAVLGAGLWMTLADPNQVENCLINLAVNARDAMPSGGKLTIETANTFLDDAYVARFGDLAAGQYVMLGVTDTGTGISQENMEKVFEPFFTTKEPGKGTGLGLAMVHGFIKQSGGHVRIYSELGEGTTVKLYLPRMAQSVAVPAAPRGAAADTQPLPRATAGETILLVEDDGAVRDYAIGALEDLGYQVLAAEGGTEALRLLAGAKRVDLLFTDVVLGGTMNGRQLAQTIAASHPALPVLFTTGYTRNAIVHQGRLDPGVNLLSKPYTQRELAQKIDALIQPPSP